jgi:hypothetical protein
VTMAHHKFYHIEDYWRDIENRVRKWDPIRVDLGKAGGDIEEAGKLLLSDRSHCCELTDDMITEHSDLQRWIKALRYWQDETLHFSVKDFCRIRELSILLCRAMANREYVFSRYEMCSEESRPDAKVLEKRDIEPNATGIEPEFASAPRLEVAKTYKTALGRNIDKYRKECGWTYAELERYAGIDKKVILNHVNKGAQARPGMLKIYSDVFTKQLGKPVSVEDLET